MGDGDSWASGCIGEGDGGGGLGGGGSEGGEGRGGEGAGGGIAGGEGGGDDGGLGEGGVGPVGCKHQEVSNSCQERDTKGALIRGRGRSSAMKWVDCGVVRKMEYPCLPALEHTQAQQRKQKQ